MALTPGGRRTDVSELGRAARRTKASEDNQAARRVGGMLSTVRAALLEWLASDDGRAARAAWEESQAHLAVVERLARRLRSYDDPAAVALAAAELHEAAHVVGDQTAALVLLEVVHEALAAACGTPSPHPAPQPPHPSALCGPDGARGAESRQQDAGPVADGSQRLSGPVWGHR